MRLNFWKYSKFNGDSQNAIKTPRNIFVSLDNCIWSIGCKFFLLPQKYSAVVNLLSLSSLIKDNIDDIFDRFEGFDIFARIFWYIWCVLIDIIYLIYLMYLNLVF